jgi:hypothetical protein
VYGSRQEFAGNFDEFVERRPQYKRTQGSVKGEKYTNGNIL